MKCSNCNEEMKLEQIDGEDWYVCENCKIRKKADAHAHSQYADMTTGKKKMSKCLLIAFILGVLYIIYSISYWSGAVGAGNDAEQVGGAIATALVMPHLIITFIAVIFNALGCFLKKRGFALTGAILYAVAMALFPVYFFFVIIQMILSFVGFAKMPK